MSQPAVRRRGKNVVALCVLRNYVRIEAHIAPLVTLGPRLVRQLDSGV